MSTPVTQNLRPEKALIFRITARANVPWILANGLHCRSSLQRDPDFVTIGNEELIERRAHRAVPIPPGGTLADYIPFYFTPYSPMLLNIRTGYGGVPRRANSEIVILVTSLFELASRGLPFVFCDRHAYLKQANFWSDLAALHRIDFELLRQRDFRRDPEDPEKLERYQAEALVHRHLPASALTGIVGYDASTVTALEAQLGEQHRYLKVLAKPTWYFGC